MFVITQAFVLGKIFVKMEQEDSRRKLNITYCPVGISASSTNSLVKELGISNMIFKQLFTLHSLHVAIFLDVSL